MSIFKTPPIALAATAACAALLAGCGGDFDPPSLINSLRPLAIRASPPAIAPPTSPGTTELDALVVGGAAGERCYAWSLCAFVSQGQGRYGCADPKLNVELGTDAKAAITQADVLQLLAGATELAEAAGTNPIDLGANAGGEDRELELTVNFAVAERDAFAAGCPKSAAEWLAAGCNDPERCVIGRKTLRVTSETTANPVIDGLDASVSDGVVSLRPTWQAADTALLFSWFSTSGTFEKQRSFDDEPDNALTLDAGAGSVTTWVVGRDGDGGVAWRKRDIDNTP